MSHILCVGIGHVGLPLSLKLWEVGHHVSLVDIEQSKIERLERAEMPFAEAGCDRLLEQASGSSRFEPLMYDSDGFLETVAAAEYILLTLGTPLAPDYTFRFDQYFDALDRLTPHLRRGVTLIVRSTVAPHFTRNVVTARIARERRWTPGIDFFPSFCPERLVEGQALRDIDELPEIVGADDQETAKRVTDLVASLSPSKRCLHVSTVEAELAKLFLNTYRYTMFGLANEFAQISEQYGANVHHIVAAANSDYPRGGIPRPGPSRGPCLGKDTATLAFSTTASLISHAAIKTNENLVLYAAQQLRAALGSFVGRRITVLGMAFKANSDDTRDNLTNPLVNLLDREGASTGVYDPLVDEYGDPGVLESSDAVVLMTSHDLFCEWDEQHLVKLVGRPREEIVVSDLWNVWPWADQILGVGSDEYEHPGYRGLRLAYASGGTSTP